MTIAKVILVISQAVATLFWPLINFVRVFFWLNSVLAFAVSAVICSYVSITAIDPAILIQYWPIAYVGVYLLDIFFQLFMDCYSQLEFVLISRALIMGATIAVILGIFVP